MTSSTSQATCTELPFMWVSSVCQWFHYKFTSVFSKNYQGGMLAVQILQCF